MTLISSQEVAVAKCALLLLQIIHAASAPYEISISKASPGNHILREEHTNLLDFGVLEILSEIPVTIQRFMGDIDIPNRASCRNYPIDEREGMILVTSSCDTSETNLIPNIFLEETTEVPEWDYGGSPHQVVSSVNISLGLSLEKASVMDFLEPTSYTAESSYLGCTRNYPGGRMVLDCWVPTTSSNSAFSPQSIMAIARGVYSKVMVSMTRQEVRKLDSCTYNADVFLHGCSPRMVNVTAPKIRVADATANYTELISSASDTESEFNDTVVFTFPAEQMTNLGNTSTVPVQIEAVKKNNKMGFCRGGGCMVDGRPFIDASGRSLQAIPLLMDDSCWSQGGRNVSPKLAPTQNEISLGEEWTQRALAEHSSIASFSAFSISLMTNGAPSDLVEDSFKAGLDEIRHASISFQIASTLMDKVVEPGPLPKSRHVFYHNLTQMAVSVAREGCIDETLSAFAAAVEVEMMSTGSSKYRGITNTTLVKWVKDELVKIAYDESIHSALAWRTLKWVCHVDTDACREVEQKVFDEAKIEAVIYHRFHDSFGSYNAGSLMKLISDSWRKIYNMQSRLISPVHANSMSGDSIGKASLIDSLVESILQSVMQY